MDALVSAAARALSTVDPLGALRLIALRDDPPALALRGIAMAQLGEFAVSRKLLRRAARAFGDAEPTARARCIAAEAEVALVCRDLSAAGKGLEEAAAVLSAHGDLDNAAFVRLQLVRRQVLLGDLGAATRALSKLALERAPARIVALAELVGADIAMRTVRARDARRALERARIAAERAATPALAEEVERAARALAAPVVRVVASGAEEPLALDAVESLFRSDDMLVDACRREVRRGPTVIPLRSRPVLFSLALALAENPTRGATRGDLLIRAFGARRPNESLRVRLRVEIGRLRRVLAPLAGIQATKDGFSLLPKHRGRVLVLLPPAPGDASALLALLGGGESWSTSALAQALGRSQRAVQRDLVSLEANGRVWSVGRGRARRWQSAPVVGFATTLLLVARDPTV